MTVSMKKCKRGFALLWFVAGGGLLLFLVVRSLANYYGAENGRLIWEWLLPSLAPTLSLIIGVLAIDATRRREEGKADRFFFLLSFFLSAAYLLALWGTILAPDLLYESPVAVLPGTRIWLPVFQGFVSASLGAFFVKGGS